jgi:hypothetical protein
MKILTFGSCLSRYIAVALTGLYPQAFIANSAYHNRIDAILANYVDSISWLPPIATFQHGQRFGFKDAKPLLLEGTNDTPLRSSALIANQYPQGLGLHNLSPHKRTPLMTTLTKGHVDLIIVDNYVDIGGRLLHLNEAPEQRFFYNHGWLTQGADDVTPGELLPVDEGLAAWERWLGLLKQYQPQAQLVLAPFPKNAFASPVRTERAKHWSIGWWELIRSHPDWQAWMLPTTQVHKRYLDQDDPLHFDDAFYGLMAGALLARLGQFNWLDGASMPCEPQAMVEQRPTGLGWFKRLVGQRYASI